MFYKHKQWKEIHEEGLGGKGLVKRLRKEVIIL